MNATQKDILIACVNDYEILYFIFAEVNFGGQVFTQNNRDFSIKVSILAILREIENLVRFGYLECRSVDTKERLQFDAEKLYVAYKDYCCITFEEHKEKYGYGPYEFKTTEEGVKFIK